MKYIIGCVLVLITIVIWFCVGYWAIEVNGSFWAFAIFMVIAISTGAFLGFGVPFITSKF